MYHKKFEKELLEYLQELCVSNPNTYISYSDGDRMLFYHNPTHLKND